MPLAAYGNALGLVRVKTVSPAGAPHEDATVWNGPGKLEFADRKHFVWDQFPMTLPCAASGLPRAGTSDLAEVPTLFLENSE